MLHSDRDGSFFHDKEKNEINFNIWLSFDVFLGAKKHEKYHFSLKIS